MRPLLLSKEGPVKKTFLNVLIPQMLVLGEEMRKNPVERLMLK